MTDAIRPALTPEEWAGVTGNRPPPHMRSLGILTHDNQQHLRRVAVHNHALPDGHPNKFTRADVDMLNREANELSGWAREAESEAEMHTALDRATALIRLRDRIAALLPPE